MATNVPASRDAYRTFAQEKAAEAAELRVTVQQLSRRVKRAEYLLERVYSSWTWRVGRLILFPVSIAKYVRDKKAGHR